MPIVDAYASLGGEANSVTRYLERAVDMHVLRLVAVQQSTQTSIQHSNELALLQSQSVTRGLGGFPNAIVAYCDIFDFDALSSLVKQQQIEKLKGLHCVLETVADSPGSPLKAKLGHPQKSLQLLAEKQLCLEITTVSACYAAVVDWAKSQPTLNVVVNISLNIDVFDRQALDEELDNFRLLSSAENIHLKLYGAGLKAEDITACLNRLLGPLLGYFDDTRLLFGTGLNNEDNHPVGAATFDEIWQSYMSGCEYFTARARDNLLRSNAIRLYLQR